MGLKNSRDRLCLVQISSGDNTSGNLYTATSSYISGDVARMTDSESENTTLISSDTYILGSPTSLPY